MLTGVVTGGGISGGASSRGIALLVELLPEVRLGLSGGGAGSAERVPLLVVAGSTRSLLRPVTPDGGVSGYSESGRVGVFPIDGDIVPVVVRAPGLRTPAPGGTDPGPAVPAPMPVAGRTPVVPAIWLRGVVFHPCGV